MVFSDRKLKEKFDSYPEPERRALLRLRKLIFETGSKLTLFGEVEESLKWNQASYRILGRRIGTPIRIDAFENNKIALFVSSNTSLIQQYKKRFGNQFEYYKNRAIIIDPNKKLAIADLAICIDMAFTYHITQEKY